MSFKLIILLNVIISMTQAKKLCEPNMCDTVRCAMADKTECESTQNGVYIDRNVNLCQCCSVCVKKLNIGDDCRDSTVTDITPTALCAPGLVCSRDNVTCVKSETSSRRALHYVLKIGNRPQNIAFFRDNLGMTVLRHEEFTDCKDSCNGPYDGCWSRTMIGYGSEDDNYDLELIYNYSISGYKLGNELNSITIESKRVLNYFNATKDITLESPDGYKFLIKRPISDDTTDRISRVSLSSSSLERSIDYWYRLLGMALIESNDTTALLEYKPNECVLELIAINGPVTHENASGRSAISCAEEELPAIESLMKSENQTILEPLVSYETPGKATVQVVILADPDGHEICFVGDIAFRQLSQIDPKADEQLNKAMKEDKSDEWFLNKGLSKQKL